MSTTSRQSLSRSVKRQLWNYYGGKRCVVTKSENAEFHHIDEDNSNTSFVNLVPVSSTINSPKLRDAQRRSRNSQPVLLAGALAPDALIHQANVHFAEWEVSLSYGCARLAYFIGIKYLSMDEESCLPYSCAAMYFARHTANHALIRDILQRDFTPIAQRGRVSTRMHALIIQELAGIYSEHGQHTKSLRLYQLIPDSVAATSEMTAAKFSALLRRKATAIMAEHGPNATASSLLKEARDTSPHSENLTSSIANTLAWHRLAIRDYRGAMDVLESLHDHYANMIFNPNDEPEPIAITEWNAAEVFHNYAIAAAHLGGRYKKRSDQAMAHAAKLYQRHGTFPFPIREGDRHLRDAASQRGVATTPVASRLPVDIDERICAIVECLQKAG